MARKPRGEVLDPTQIEIAHIVTRTVRRCFLLGDDQFTGRNFDHRKVWIEEKLKHFAACFGIDLLCYSILSNHFHLVLRSRPDVVESWDDTEIARRWLMICPQRKVAGKPAQPSEAELNSIRNCPVMLDEIRIRLSSISWWMKQLNQPIAQRANREDGESGRFWQDRFHCTKILDEESLLACAVYVDLNPIRAAMAETLEQSDFTSAQRRIEAQVQERTNPTPASERRDAFLAKLTINEANDPIGPQVSKPGPRCSEKGFLSLSTGQYLELLDWTARQRARGKRGQTPAELPGVLQRLGLDGDRWLSLVENFESAFCHVAGRADRVDAVRSHITQRRFYLRPPARRLLPSLN